MLRFERNCRLALRPNGQMICRVCNERMQHGDPCLSLWGSNCHRVCMKRFVEWSLEMMPMTEHELDLDPTGDMRAVEYGRMRREFEEYRQKLIGDLSCEE